MSLGKPNIKNHNLDSKTAIDKIDKPRVNINDLLFRVRREKTKEKKENLVFISLIFTVVTVTGIIVSL